MATVILPSLLRERAGGIERIVVDGGTVEGALRGLERHRPGLRGWILDERGAIRPHVKVFVNDLAASLETPLSRDDELHIVPAISGG